jgi:hypothetical protein
MSARGPFPYNVAEIEDVEPVGEDKAAVKNFVAGDNQSRFDAHHVLISQAHREQCRRGRLVRARAESGGERRLDGALVETNVVTVDREPAMRLTDGVDPADPVSAGAGGLSGPGAPPHDGYRS